jgi:electron transfer flavoprotein alpha subunit
MKILVYVEVQADKISGTSLELIAGARQMAAGGTVELALFGLPAAAALGLGADRIYTDPSLAAAPYNPAQHGAGLGLAIDRAQPDLTLVGYTTAGLDIGPSIAMQRSLPMFAYCLNAKVDGTGVQVESQIYGGKLKSSSHSAFPALLMMNAGAFRDAPEPQARDTEVVELSIGAAPTGIRFVQATAPDPNAIDITKARRLLCVGRGIGDADVIEEARETAALMGAELVGSRPVIDAGWLPKELQVGKSGRKVKPQVYLSIGVSGAPEHIEGMGDSGLIIAINTDAAAPIFDHAHFGATVDQADFLPALREALEHGAG